MNTVVMDSGLAPFRAPGMTSEGASPLKLGILRGDDIGLEVVPECVKAMQAAASRTGLELQWEELPIGKAGHEAHGHTLPKVTEEGLRALPGWIMGPIGHAAYPRGDATWVMPPVRKKFDLFAAVRPSLSHANLPSMHKNVDIVFFREITEGMLYSETVVAGAPEFRPNDEITVAMRVITRKGSHRVACEAFEMAASRKVKKVTAAHKEPVYRLACGMFAEECRKVAREFPSVTFEDDDRLDRHEARHRAAAVRRNRHHQSVRRYPHRHRRRPGGGIGAGARALHRREAGDGAGDARLGAGHCRPQHRQPVRDDHVRADADGVARPQAQRAQGGQSGAAHSRRRAARDRRGQAPHAGPGRHGEHPGDGRRHRRGGAEMITRVPPAARSGALRPGHTRVWYEAS